MRRGKRGYKLVTHSEENGNKRASASDTDTLTVNQVRVDAHRRTWASFPICRVTTTCGYVICHIDSQRA